MKEDRFNNIQIRMIGEESAPEVDGRVVIDVVRAFTCAAIALGRGANSIVCVGDVQPARLKRKEEPSLILMGEEHGIKPVGFDLGNSPREASLWDFALRNVVQVTTNGTRGLTESSTAKHCWAVSALNVGATSNSIMKSGVQNLEIVVTDSSTIEDMACAKYIVRLLTGQSPDKTLLRQTVLASAQEHKRLWRRTRSQEEFVQFLDDIQMCSEVDMFNFAMTGVFIDDGVVELKKSD